jgi:hypothetical protein
VYLRSALKNNNMQMSDLSYTAMNAPWPQLSGTPLQSLIAPLPPQLFAIYDHQNPGRLFVVLADGAGNLTALPPMPQSPYGLQHFMPAHANFQPAGWQPGVLDARLAAGLHSYPVPFPLSLPEVERPWPLHGVLASGANLPPTMGIDVLAAAAAAAEFSSTAVLFQPQTIEVRHPHGQHSFFHLPPKESYMLHVASLETSFRPFSLRAAAQLDAPRQLCQLKRLCKLFSPTAFVERHGVWARGGPAAANGAQSLGADEHRSLRRRFARRARGARFTASCVAPARRVVEWRSGGGVGRVCRVRRLVGRRGRRRG